MPLHSGFYIFVTTQTSSTRIVIKSTNKRYCPAWTSFNKLNSICNHPHKMVPCTHYTRRRRRGRQGQGRGRFAIPDHASVSPPSKAQAAGSGRTGENKYECGCCWPDWLVSRSLCVAAFLPDVHSLLLVCCSVCVCVWLSIYIGHDCTEQIQCQSI